MAAGSAEMVHAATAEAAVPGLAEAWLQRCLQRASVSLWRSGDYWCWAAGMTTCTACTLNLSGDQP